MIHKDDASGVRTGSGAKRVRVTGATVRTPGPRNWKVGVATGLGLGNGAAPGRTTSRTTARRGIATGNGGTATGSGEPVSLSCRKTKNSPSYGQA